MMLILTSPYRTAVFLARIVMPFSRSRSIESMTRSATSWFDRNAPDCHSILSTSVVLPWSTWATMATLRRSARSSKGCPSRGGGPSYGSVPLRRTSGTGSSALQGQDAGARGGRRPRRGAGVAGRDPAVQDGEEGVRDRHGAGDRAVGGRDPG